MITQQVQKAAGCLRWLPTYAWQRAFHRAPSHNATHLMIAVADHFEPSFTPDGMASADEQERRLERWCRDYPKMADRYRDAEGRPFQHTYFYPAEQYYPGIIDRLADHCRDGWGEIEVHLHHGLDGPDTAENTRRVLMDFRDGLAARGCLSRWEGTGPPRYAFVHGNWALANSARNRFCGVDSEMQILADTGCYADLTLPSAPSRGQVAKINSLYECALPMGGRAPHRRGHDLRKGRAPTKFPLMVQGPLGLRGGSGALPRIENGELTTANPPTLNRLRSWTAVPITVQDRPDWLFIKLHCHGMDPRDEAAMYGEPMAQFLRELADFARHERRNVHFVTAREMVNIILAACDGRDGNPGDYRDHRLRLTTPSRTH